MNQEFLLELKAKDELERKPWLILKVYYIKANLLFPILVPSLIGGMIYNVLYHICRQFVSTEYDTHIMILSFVAAFLYTAKKVMYNIAFVEFVRNYMKEKRG